MMKTVYVVRHAKSSWDVSDLPDEKRPLLEKGKKRTKKVIDSLLELDIHVDYIISSHAVRAHETARILAHALKYPEDHIKIDSHLYYTDGDGIPDQFLDLPDRYSSVMIVGHNPAMTDFVNLYLADPIDQLPTSGIVSITFESDHWDSVMQSAYKVNLILFPKDLP
jgi:phosphohistidine phosphatase